MANLELIGCLYCIVCGRLETEPEFDDGGPVPPEPKPPCYPQQGAKPACSWVETLAWDFEEKALAAAGGRRGGLGGMGQGSA